METAERLAEAIKAHDKREGLKTQPWEKLKVDRQIIAIAIVEGATAIYSTDEDIHKVAERWGLKAITPADLTLPAKQLPLEGGTEPDATKKR